jgi:cell division control protein 45
MFIPTSSYSTAYSHILSRARGSPSCTTYLFVSPDVDALCAARLLSGLLKNDDVAHQTVPVGSWVDLMNEAVQIKEEDVRYCPFLLLSFPRLFLSSTKLDGTDLFCLNNQVRNLILINLGATADLYAIFGPSDPETGQQGLDFPPSCMIHVVDSHQPIALSNLFTGNEYANAVFDPRRKGPGGRLVPLGAMGGLPREELAVVVWDELRAAIGEDEDGPWKREREAFEELEVRFRLFLCETSC